MDVLSLSHKKLSGKVFTDSDYQGTKQPVLNSPEFHNHLPTIFYEQRV
jgi:hypothetical protein